MQSWKQDDFFSDATGQMLGCPRQVSVTYREEAWNTWVVRKWMKNLYSSYNLYWRTCVPSCSSSRLFNTSSISVRVMFCCGDVTYFKACVVSPQRFGDGKVLLQLMLLYIRWWKQILIVYIYWKRGFYFNFLIHTKIIACINNNQLVHPKKHWSKEHWLLWWWTKLLLSAPTTVPTTSTHYFRSTTTVVRLLRCLLPAATTPPLAVHCTTVESGCRRSWACYRRAYFPHTPHGLFRIKDLTGGLLPAYIFLHTVNKANNRAVSIL